MNTRFAMLRHLLIIGTALACATASAQPTPTLDQFGWHQPIETANGEAIHRFALGADAYAGAARADLGDLRIFNAAGEVVPYALVRREAQSETLTRATTLRYFPLHARAQSGVSGQVDIDVRRNANGSLVAVRMKPEQAAAAKLSGYVIDASAVDAPIAALEVAWASQADGLATAVDVEASDDLQTWRGVVQDAQLVELRMGDQQLLRNRVELDGVRAKYLRLSWTDDRTAPVLQKVVAHTQTTQARSTPTQWTAPIAARAGAEPGEYLFEAPGVPVQALRIALPQTNTVAPMRLYRRDDAKTPWIEVANTVAFRIQRNAQEVTAPDLAIARSGAREWRIVVDQRGGGLGSGMPQIQLAWVPHQAVFVARGAGPYTLAFGNRNIAPAPFDIATLVPGYRDEQFASLPLARLGTATRTAAAAAAPTVAKPTSFNARTAGLWAVLVIGVLALGFMAWRLMRQVEPGGRS